MKGKGIGRLFSGIVLALACVGPAVSSAEESQPAWAFEVKESSVADFEVPQLHAKDEGWLLTCRMRVKSTKLVSPISEIEFKGYDAAKELVWEKSHTIRRKDFEAAYGGGRSQFVRVFFSDVPAEVVSVELTYGETDDSEAAE